MNKKKTALAAAWIVSLVCGGAVAAALGARYHTELNSMWWGMPPAEESVAEPTPAPPTPTPEPGSFITLPGITEPLPLVFSATLDEAAIQEHLKDGAVVLPLGIAFGEPGNVVVTAHSSGTESFGPYRFAFAKLSELNEGDEYSISTPEATYHYKVYKKEIVWPHEVNKLPQDDQSTVTLVTCWPLWTNFKRLLVHTELTSIEYKI